jgi:transcription initiation factor IIE alpha subunit
MCTAKEAKARPSIRQVLALLYENRHIKLESEIANLGSHLVSSDILSYPKPPRLC